MFVQYTVRKKWIGIRAGTPLAACAETRIWGRENSGSVISIYFDFLFHKKRTQTQYKKREKDFPGLYIGIVLIGNPLPDVSDLPRI